MRRKQWLPLLPILGGFLILGLFYARATPIFEASDELWHFGMVDYIADNWRLPVQNPDVKTTYRQEGSQPPLYYVISALLVSGINRDDYESYLEYNPHARVGMPGSVGNKNILLHDTLHPPAQDTAQAVYILRGFGVLLASITVFAVYATALQISGPSYATLAAALTAFNPMFLFISASVNNDNLVTALVSLVIWQVVVMGWHGFKLWRSTLIAVGIALAALTKLSGLVLVPVVLFAAGYLAYRDDKHTGFSTLFVITLLTGLAVSGWWYLRNILLYGELFGTEMMVQVAGPRLEPFTPLTLVNEAWGFFISYWALFGGVNIPIFEAYYWLALLVSLTAAIGLGLSLRRSLPDILRYMREYGRVFAVTDLLHIYWLYAAAVFAGAALLGLVGVITWTAQTYASQGRLLFPFIVGLSALTASGLQYFARHQQKWPLTYSVAGVFGGMALLIPFTHITPAYQPPSVVAAVPEAAETVYARFGEIELLGYDIPNGRYAPGDRLPLTVYWRANAPSQRDLSAYLTAVDVFGQEIGKVDTYPGAGSLRTTTWEPGVIYADEYGIWLNDRYPDGTIIPASDMRVQVGWWHYPTGAIIQPVDATETPLNSVMLDAGGYLGTLALAESRYSRVQRGVTWDNNRIQLIGAYTDFPTRVELVWRANRRVQDDYTVFVQMIDNRTGEIVSQADAPPRLSTEYWQRGDLFLTTYDLPFDEVFQPGNYTVYVGWYAADVEGFPRLNLRGDDDNALPLGTFSFP